MYTNITIKKIEKSQVEITGSIEAVAFGKFRAKALKNINESISIDGFRKGNIPEKILVTKVGEMPILEEMAELALAKAYPDIVIENKIDAIGRPQIQITKIAAGNPLEFRITTAVIPEVQLADYKKIAGEINASHVTEIEKAGGASAVSEKDVDEAINRIRRSHAEHNHAHDESHDAMSKEDHNKEIEAAMPVLDDAFVATLGGGFANVADFKDKLQTMLADDKKQQLREKNRITLSDKVSDATQVEIPDVLTDSEVRRIEAQFKEDVTRMGVSFDDYLKHAKKSVEEIRKEWRPHAEKKAKLQIVLNKIAEAEKIAPTEKEIEEEAAHITDHYKDANKEHAYIYAETVLLNEKVFQFLEAIK